MGKLESEQSGVGSYLLHHLNGNVNKGRPVIVGPDSKGLMKLSFQTLGLENEPRYLKNLGVKADAFTATRMTLKDSSAAAIKYWSTWFTEDGYNGAVLSLRKKYSKIEAKKDVECNKQCVQLIRKHFNALSKKKGTSQVDLVQPLSTSCRDMWQSGDFSPPKACFWEHPSVEAIKTEAMAIAKAKLAQHAEKLDIVGIEKMNEERAAAKAKARAAAESALSAEVPAPIDQIE